MGLFERLFGRKEQPAQRAAPVPSREEEDGAEAVLVHLDGNGLPDRVYEECDLATLEDRLIEILARERLGKLDGNEMGPLETTLFLRGPDAEKLFAAIEPALRAYPLCAGARVVLRRGGPGSPERELRLT